MSAGIDAQGGGGELDVDLRLVAETGFFAADREGVARAGERERAVDEVWAAGVSRGGGDGGKGEQTGEERDGPSQGWYSFFPSGV